MELTSAAAWLNSAFAGYDAAILGAMHSLGEAAGTVLTPIMKLITLLGEKGLLLFLLALVFMCFASSRKSGICIFGAVCCGALITNIILKDMIARPRPFETAEQFAMWWQAIGAPAEDGFSFPSGHVTAAAAGLTALCLTKGKKFILPSALIVMLMGISRNYLMAHYPSDVLFAIIIGLASAFIAYLITRLIYKLLEAHGELPFFDFILNWSLPLSFAAHRASPAARPSEGRHSSASGSHAASGRVRSGKTAYQGKHLR